jgi:hypothetical protein
MEHIISLGWGNYRKFHRAGLNLIEFFTIRCETKSSSIAGRPVAKIVKSTIRICISVNQKPVGSGNMIPSKVHIGYIIVKQELAEAKVAGIASTTIFSIYLN